MFTIFCPDIMFTEQCNLRCKYCFENKNKSKMNKEKLIEYIKKQTNFSYFPFGGEPMLELDTILEAIDAIEDMKMPSHRKDKLLQTMRHIITNGTLIKENLEVSAKYGLDFQISMDGPKHIHDANRVFADGKTGSYDKCIEAIEAIEEFNNEVREGRKIIDADWEARKALSCGDESCDRPNYPTRTVQWSIHGVVNKETLKDIFEISKWNFELMLKYKDMDRAIDHIGGNCYQIIFEESYTDKDVDTLIEQVNLFCQWIWEQDFDVKIKQKIIEAYLTRRGGVCSLGTTLAALDTNFNLYPCHRLATGDDRENYCLGNVYKPKEFKNFNIFNQSYHQRYRSQESYSSHVDVNFSNDIHWFMWCPATNFEETKSVFYQNPRYNLMHYELNRFIKLLFIQYGIRR